MSSRIDPAPRDYPHSVNDVNWTILNEIAVPPLVPPLDLPFRAVLEARRTVREITPAPFREVVNAVSYAARPRFINEGAAHVRSLRPSMSAGALHPIEILLRHPAGSGGRVYHYAPLTHTLRRLRVFQISELQRLQHQAARIQPNAIGTMAIFVARHDISSAYYQNHVSLLWRDAGALLQTLGMVCTAYRLAFCPLGILGSEIIDALALDRGITEAVGLGLIGRERSPERD